jgi:hypothetical protein
MHRSAPNWGTANDLSRRSSIDQGLGAWLFVVLCLAVRDVAPWISHYPPEWVLPIAPAIDPFSTAVTAFVKPAFRGIDWMMDWPMRGIRAVLQSIPLPITLVLVGVTALRAGGCSLAWFALATLVYLQFPHSWLACPGSDKLIQR